MDDFAILAEFSARLAEQGIRHFVGGSVASSAWGEPRMTNDVDIVVHVEAHNAANFARAASGDFHHSARELSEASEHPRPWDSVQVNHVPSALKFDCFLVRSELEREELDRAIPAFVAEGVSVPMATPEYVVVAKCRWYDLGHRVSDRQWNDILQVLSAQKGRLDLVYVESKLQAFGLSDLWERLSRVAP
jgi:predicted nucleotidyltransferase